MELYVLFYFIRGRYSDSEHHLFHGVFESYELACEAIPAEIRHTEPPELYEDHRLIEANAVDRHWYVRKIIKGAYQ